MHREIAIKLDIREGEDQLTSTNQETLRKQLLNKLEKWSCFYQLTLVTIWLNVKTEKPNGKIVRMEHFIDIIVVDVKKIEFKALEEYIMFIHLTNSDYRDGMIAANKKITENLVH